MAKKNFGLILVTSISISWHLRCVTLLYYIPLLSFNLSESFYVPFN
jgi:hypothetical protein